MHFDGKKMPSIKQLESIFRRFKFEEELHKYRWEGSFHKKLGREPDKWPEFKWIRDIERRTHGELSENGHLSRDCAIEIIKWGTGGRHGPLNIANNINDWEERTQCAYTKKKEIPTVLENHRDIVNGVGEAYLELAIHKKNIKGLGLTYFSKILRFMNPDKFGARDAKFLSSLFKKGWKDANGNTFSLNLGHYEDRKAEARAYGRFCWVLQVLAAYQNRIGLLDDGKEKRKWRAADIEMSLFGFAMHKAKMNCCSK